TMSLMFSLSLFLTFREEKRREEKRREEKSEPPYQNLTTAVSMERVQHMTKSAIRRASQIEVNPQAKRNLQELFVNFTLILICLLLIYIIVLLSS
ncbi:Cardiac phospholamban, partial [Nibea albiflora]